MVDKLPTTVSPKSSAEGGLWLISWCLPGEEQALSKGLSFIAVPPSPLTPEGGLSLGLCALVIVLGLAFSGAQAGI